MATTVDFIEFVCEQIDAKWDKRYRKMFGEYMVYVNDKPILLVCDNTVFAKKLDCLKALVRQEDTGVPYKGAKEHYVVDVDDQDGFNKIVQELEKVIKVPVKRRRKA